jgi:hypothetical protein
MGHEYDKIFISIKIRPFRKTATPLSNAAAGDPLP